MEFEWQCVDLKYYFIFLISILKRDAKKAAQKIQKKQTHPLTRAKK